MSEAYFLSDNSSRLISAQGFDFIFEPYDQVGGVWRGTYATDKEAEIIALRSLMETKRSLREITREEYDELLKKKGRTRVSRPSVVRAPVPPLPAQIIQRSAVLVEEPSPAPESAPELGPIVKDIASVVKIAEVKPSDPEAMPRKVGKRKKG